MILGFMYIYFSLFSKLLKLVASLYSDHWPQPAVLISPWSRHTHTHTHLIWDASTNKHTQHKQKKLIWSDYWREKMNWTKMRNIKQRMTSCSTKMHENKPMHLQSQSKETCRQSGSDGIPVPDPSRPENWKWLGTG